MLFSSRKQGLTAGAVAVLCLALYWPAVQSDFAGDDFLHLERIASESDPLAADAYGFFRPLTQLSLQLDYTLWGLDPLPFHLENLLLHLASALLLVVVLRRLGLAAEGALAGAIFLVHPLQVEQVSWISARADLLSALLALGAILAYLRFRESGRRGGFGLACALTLLAMSAKEVAAVLPLLLLGLERVAPVGPQADDESGGTKTPWAPLAGLAGVAVAFLVLRWLALGEAIGGYPAEIFHFGLRVPFEMAVGLGRTLLPADAMSGALPGLSLALGAVVLVAALLLAVVRPPRAVGAATLGLTWFAVAILPVAPFLALRVTRHLYFPAIGGCIVLAALLVWLGERLPSPAMRRVAALAFLAALALLTRQGVATWYAGFSAAEPVRAQLEAGGEPRPGEVIFIFNAPTNRHHGPPTDTMLTTQLSLALAPPFAGHDWAANHYRLAVEPASVRTFLWHEDERRLEAAGAARWRGSRQTLPRWPRLEGWVAEDLELEAGGWAVAGARPALASPPLELPAFGVSEVEIVARRLECRRFEWCDFEGRIRQTWRPSEWRLHWLVEEGDWTSAPALSFTLSAAAGRQRVFLAPANDYRWHTTGTIRRLVLVPPPDVVPFAIERFRLISRYEGEAAELASTAPQ